MGKRTSISSCAEHSDGGGIGSAETDADPGETDSGEDEMDSILDGNEETGPT